MKDGNLAWQLVCIGIVIFVIWSFSSSAKENREALITSAVESVCERHFQNFDCLGMGSDVVREYNKQAEESGPRD